MLKIIECVPNFSEGRDLVVIEKIADTIRSIDGVKLLDVDPGKATNRTVMTMVGDPELVIEAAFQAIKKASELIDMRQHKGEHPRMGATDVCPLIPVSGISMAETILYANRLAKRVGDELKIPVYLYEAAASVPERSNLATIRSGEYEGFEEKMKNPEWKPDFGPTVFNLQNGATVIGARNFLIAYNVNLNTTSERRANSVAFDVREQGRVLRKDNKYNGEILRDQNGDPVRQAGTCKSVKGIGWFIPEYGIAQVSMNLTDIHVTPMHIAFEACVESAAKRGMRVTGSELIGLLPKQVLLDAGKFYLLRQDRSAGVSEKELIHIAIKSMGLDELSAFDPQKKIIEYAISDSSKLLVDMSLTEFADETASESMAPGGGSISAYAAALGISLGTMVANLSAAKKGWEKKCMDFSDWATKGQQIKDELLRLVDADTQAFNAIIEAIRMPKETESEKNARSTAMEAANIHATEIPLKVMQIAASAYPLIDAMVKNGNPNSITDAAVGSLCLDAAIHGAFLNVKVNAPSIQNKEKSDALMNEASEILENSKSVKSAIWDYTQAKLQS